jgi:hypothetical protein
MTKHPLRKRLTKSDWERINKAVDTEIHDNVSLEELDAAHDVYYDIIAGAEQTHAGVTTVQ